MNENLLSLERWDALTPSDFVPLEPNSDTEQHDRVNLRRVCSIPPGPD